MKAHFSKLITLAAASLLPLWLSAQTVREEIEANPDKAGYVYSMYDFDTPATAKAPKGYKPFYISHYGRHGARFSGSNPEFVNVRRILLAAREEGNLTDLGEDVLRRYETVFPMLEYRTGDLTQKGYAQQKKLAARMLR
ncbi:MAG: histidine-type phosphatase, partial [Bacteroidales bacterium]|nr:histidine-type phosphatase [Bacteroidales bacterium]